jgi:hypothetical protein
MDKANMMKFVRAAWKNDRIMRYAVFTHLQDVALTTNGTTTFGEG